MVAVENELENEVEFSVATREEANNAGDDKDSIARCD
jgi:hypothetical protein